MIASLDTVGTPLECQLPGHATNIRLGWKRLLGINALAYLAGRKKRFTTLVQDWKHKRARFVPNGGNNGGRETRQAKAGQRYEDVRTELRPNVVVAAVGLQSGRPVPVFVESGRNFQIFKVLFWKDEILDSGVGLKKLPFLRLRYKLECFFFSLAECLWSR